MEEFLNKLYNYEYFGTYLMIAIAVLVLLFIIVLFFGKKDQKKREIEETKKLQQINNTDAFKEENNVASVEVPKEKLPQQPVLSQEKLENDTIIVPSIQNIVPENNIEHINEIPEPILKNEEVNNIFKEEPIVDNPISNENVSSVIEPVLDKVEEKPLVFNEPQPTLEEPISIHEEPEVPTTPLVDVPDFNFNEIISEIGEENEEVQPKTSTVFSSVYAPEKEEVELPKIEEKRIKDDDMTIELPNLKKEETVEKPILNDYNLDNIVGEDYNINK